MTGGVDRRFGKRAAAPAKSVGALGWVRSALRSGGEAASPAPGGTLEPSPEQALRLLQLFETSGKGWFWETDREGRVVYLTASVAGQLKRGLAELIGAEFHDLLAPDEGQEEATQRS